MPDVRIVDLEIIKRFSLAVRTEYADADDVLEALEASLDEVRGAADGGRRKKRTTRKKTGSRSKPSRGRKTTKKKSSSRSGSKR